MKLVMTLLVRDEADIVDAQIAFHLDAGVDFVVATDNRSEDGDDGDPRALRARGTSAPHPRAGRRPSPERVGDAHGAARGDRVRRRLGPQHRRRRVLVAARRRASATLFAAVPARFGVVRGAWRNFVPRPDDDRFFAERMTARLLHAVVPSASARARTSSRRTAPCRTFASVAETTRRSERGSSPLRGWYPIEILHFPVRSLEHCMRKYVTQFVALERNAEKGIPGHMAEAYDAYRAGRARGLLRAARGRRRRARAGCPTRRARDRHAPARPAARRSASERLPTRRRPGARSQEPATRDELLAVARSPAEYSALQEADLGLAYVERASIASRAASLPASRRARRDGRDRDAGPGRGCSRSSRPGGPRSLLFALAFAVFWIESLGWPMAKGRDTWDYLVVLPPAPRLGPAALRAPAVPDAADAARRRAAARPRRASGCSRSCSALLYAVSILAWSATALAFGRIPALGERAPPARLSRVRDAVPPGLERRRVRDGARGLGAAARAAAGRPSTGALRGGRGRARRARAHRDRRTRCCCRSRRRAARRVRRLAPAVRAGGRLRRRRGRCRSRRGRFTTASATTTRRWRAADARGCRSSRSSLASKTIAPENGAASRRLAELIERGGAGEGAAREPGRHARRVPARTGRTTRRCA